MVQLIVSVFLHTLPSLFVQQTNLYPSFSGASGSLTISPLLTSTLVISFPPSISNVIVKDLSFTNQYKN